MGEIALKDLRAGLTKVLTSVKAGEHVVILERGERVAVIKPYVDPHPRSDLEPQSGSISMTPAPDYVAQRLAQASRDNILRGVNKKTKS